MKYLPFLMLFSFMVVFSSCENFFEQTATVDVPAHVPMLGVTALWLDEGGNNDKLVTIFGSVGALEDENSGAVSNADIILTENGVEIATFEEMSSSKGFYRPATEFDLVPGKSYELTVSAANYETVKASQVMPREPILKAANYVRSNNKLHITISDQEGQDFYVIGLQSWEAGNTGYGSLYSESGIAEDSGLDYGRVILKDETFSGGDLTQVLDGYYNSIGTTDSVLVSLFNVTSDYYRFDRTYSAVYNADGNPFAEPVILHRNFEHGFGVFALGNRVSLVLPVE